MHIEIPTLRDIIILWREKKNSLNEITRRILRRFYFTARAKSTPFYLSQAHNNSKQHCQTKVRELILRGASQAIESIAKTCPSVYVHPQTKTLNQWSSKRCSTSIQINKKKKPKIRIKIKNLIRQCHNRLNTSSQTHHPHAHLASHSTTAPPILSKTLKMSLFLLQSPPATSSSTFPIMVILLLNSSPTLNFITL